MKGCGNQAEPVEYFRQNFALLSAAGNPYPWQVALFQEFLADRVPPEICLPTGAGKTSLMCIWLLALAWEGLRRAQGPKLPRRLVWVVDRRVVVDQATEEAERLAERAAGELREALENLGVAGREDGALAVSTLRGERADNRAWSLDPSRPAVVVGTVDMIGSRLLFSGYGDGRWHRPQHAGLLGQDVILVNDEAHLTPAFANLVTAISTAQASGGLKSFRTIRLSATPRGSATRWPESLAPDLSDSPSFRQIYTAPKCLRFEEVDKRERLLSRIIELAATPGTSGGRFLIFVREPEKASELARAIRNKTGSKRVLLMTGTMRGWERDRLTGDPVFQTFASRQPPAEPCWLVATSAAEVGVNISSDTLITDLDTADHLLQRFGRLNRFGETLGQAHLVYMPADEAEQPGLQATLNYFRSLPASDSGFDISLRTLFENPPPAGAWSEEPATARLSQRLLDAWSQTSLCPHPARPPVDVWLHGKQQDLPEIEIAWRDDVSWLASPGVDPADLREALPRHRVLAHERLREPAIRARRKLQELPGQTRVILLGADGSVEAAALDELLGDAARLNYSTVLLPSGFGSIADGIFPPRAAEGPEVTFDVADLPPAPPRARYIAQRNGEDWAVQRLGAPQQTTIRLPELTPDAINSFAAPLGLELSWQVPIPSSEEDAPPQTVLLYFRGPRKKPSFGKQSLEEHLEAAAEAAKRLAEKLGLTPELAEALEWAGRLHDLGKAEPLWQIAMGGDPANPLAKTPRPGSPALLAGFRHEFASLTNGSPLARIPEHLRDVVLHLVAAHHGWSRPHFPSRAWDRRKLRASQFEALECARRFARLQARYGHWGLAYLEAVLKAADAMASAGEQPDYA